MLLSGISTGCVALSQLCAGMAWEITNAQAAASCGQRPHSQAEGDQSESVDMLAGLCKNGRRHKEADLCSKPKFLSSRSFT